MASLLNKNVFSNRLNWPYDSPHSLRFSGRLLQTCGPAAANDLAPKLKTAARPTDHECLSVGRMQLSYTGVGDELTLIQGRTWGHTGKKYEEPENENLHFLYTCLILNMMRSLVYRCIHWSPLTHASKNMSSNHTSLLTYLL